MVCPGFSIRALSLNLDSPSLFQFVHDIKHGFFIEYHEHVTIASVNTHYHVVKRPDKRHFARNRTHSTEPSFTPPSHLCADIAHDRQVA
jgi:hypothetical protein